MAEFADLFVMVNLRLKTSPHLMHKTVPSNHNYFLISVIYSPWLLKQKNISHSNYVEYPIYNSSCEDMSSNEPGDVKCLISFYPRTYVYSLIITKYFIYLCKEKKLH